MLVSELITTFSATFIEAQKCELYLAHQSGSDLIYFHSRLLHIRENVLLGKLNHLTLNSGSHVKQSTIRSLFCHANHNQSLNALVRNVTYNDEI